MGKTKFIYISYTPYIHRLKVTLCAWNKVSTWNTQFAVLFINHVGSQQFSIFRDILYFGIPDKGYSICILLNYYFVKLITAAKKCPSFKGSNLKKILHFFKLLLFLTIFSYSSFHLFIFHLPFHFIFHLLLTIFKIHIPALSTHADSIFFL